MKAIRKYLLIAIMFASHAAIAELEGHPIMIKTFGSETEALSFCASSEYDCFSIQNFGFGYEVFYYITHVTDPTPNPEPFEPGEEPVQN